MRRLCIFLAIALFSGCSTNTITSPVPLAETTTAPTVSELLQQASDCRDSAQVTHDINSKNPQAFRRRVLEARIRDGLSFAEEALSNEEILLEELDTARQIKADLLFLGVLNLETEYEEQFRTFVKQIVVDAKGTPACERAASLWLMYRFRDPTQEEFAEAEKAVLSFVRSYPSSKTSSKLIGRLALQMTEAGDTKAAKDLLGRASKIIDSPQRLAKVEHVVNKEIRQRKIHQAKVESAKNFRNAVKWKIGGREYGYFVVFSKSNKNAYCDYSVLKGLSAVVKYAARANAKDWSWRLEKAYPETSSGRRQAQKQQSDLIKRNTIPVYF